MQNYLNTFKEILRRPRNVIDGFIHSEKREFQHPFGFILIGLVLVVLLNTLFVDFSIDVNVQETGIEDEQVQQITEWIQVVTVRMSTQFFPVISAFLLIPLLSLPGVFFFREQADGFYQNLILNSYAVGTALLCLIAAIPFWMLLNIPFTDPFMNSTLPALLIAGPVLWIYKRYFGADDVIGWIRIFSSYIAGYILFIFLKGFAAGIIGYMIFAINRIIEISG